MRHNYILLVLALLSACSKQEYKASSAHINTILIMATPDANDHSPISLDIVMTSSPYLLDHLMTLDAKTYFAGRQQILRDFPRQVLIANWEVPPGHTVEEGLSSLHDPIVGAVLFANYMTRGIHRMFVPKTHLLKVQLNKNDFEIL